MLIPAGTRQPLAATRLLIRAPMTIGRGETAGPGESMIVAAGKETIMRFIAGGVGSAAAAVAAGLALAVSGLAGTGGAAADVRPGSGGCRVTLSVIPSGGFR
jgi:hypothetical protein